MPKKIIIIILAIAAASVAAYFLLVKSEEKNSVFRTTGIIEALEVEVDSKLAGRLIFVGFREGDLVNAGELVAMLDPSENQAVVDEARAAVETAQKSLAAGSSARDSAMAKSEAASSDIQRAEAELSRAEAGFELADKDYARAGELFEKGVTAKAELDTATAERSTAQAGVNAAKAVLEAARSSSKAASAAVTEANLDIETLSARLSEAESALMLAEVRLDDTKMYSPINGTVDYRYLEEGETVAPGTPVLTIVDTNDVWVRIDVDERYVGAVTQGQDAQITLEYMPDRIFKGTVFDIGREANFATERDVTRGRQDIRTFRTRIRVDDPEGVLKPGMTVIATLPLAQ